MIMGERQVPLSPFGRQDTVESMGGEQPRPNCGVHPLMWAPPLGFVPSWPHHIPCSRRGDCRDPATPLGPALPALCRPASPFPSTSHKSNKPGPSCSQDKYCKLDPVLIFNHGPRQPSMPSATPGWPRCPSRSGGRGAPSWGCP